MTRVAAALCGVSASRCSAARGPKRAAWSSGPSTAAASRRSTIRRSSRSTRSNVKDLEGRVALVRRQFRPDAGDEERDDAADDRRRAVRDGRRDAERRCDRRRQRRDAVDLAAERRRALPHGAAPHVGPRRRVLARAATTGACFTVTPGFYLWALDADTGLPKREFGEAGVVDLRRGLRGPMDNVEAGSSSPPLVVGDVVVVGPAGGVGARPNAKTQVKLDVRGFDVRTGRLLWTFHTIPENAASSATTLGSRRARPSTRATAARLGPAVRRPRARARLSARRGRDERHVRRRAARQQLVRRTASSPST